MARARKGFDLPPANGERRHFDKGDEVSLETVEEFDLVRKGLVDDGGEAESVGRRPSPSHEKRGKKK